MHELMVKPLPRQCHLTAIFDVSRQINNMDMTYEFPNDVC